MPRLSSSGGSFPRNLRAGGWWGLIIPIVILGALFIAVLRAPKETSAPLSAPGRAVFVPSFERLPPVPGGHYELWVQQPDGGEDGLAAFAVGPGGALFTLKGDPAQEFLVSELPVPGSTLLVTIEAGTEPAATRSPRVLLRGRLSETTATLEPVVPEVPDQKNVALLLAPTDAQAPDLSGVWFAAQTAQKGRPAAGLRLPVAPAGWAYGGFVQTAAGTWLPTGLFTDAAKPDGEAPYSGKRKGLALPGEDFVARAPEGTTFPLNLADGRTQVTVSLEPDFATGSTRPFLSLLSVRIPYQQTPRIAFPLEAVPREEFPKGSGSFESR